MTSTGAPSRKINSALAAFESTIQKNVQSGEHSGMYISNMVGNKAGNLGSSRHSRDSSVAKRDAQHRRDLPRRHPRSPDGKNASNETRKAAERLKKRADKMHGRSKTQERHRRLGADNPLGLGPSPTNRKSSDRSAKTETTAELSLEDISKQNSTQSKGWNSFDDSSNFFSEAEESSVGADDDFSLVSESSFQEPNWNPSLMQKKKKDFAASWANGFAVNYHHRSDGSESESDQNNNEQKVRKKAHNKKPSRSSRGANQRLAQEDPGFAITYQLRAEESDSDFDPSETREKIRRQQLIRTQSNSNLQQSSTHSSNTTPGFAFTYRQRSEESESDVDHTDVREKTGRKQNRKKPLSATVHPAPQPTALFPLSRTASSNSLNSGTEDLNQSIRSLNARVHRSPNGHKSGTGQGVSSLGMSDNFRNLVMAGTGDLSCSPIDTRENCSTFYEAGNLSCSALPKVKHNSPKSETRNSSRRVLDPESDLGIQSEREPERSDAESGRRRGPRKPKALSRPVQDDGFFSDASAIPATKPKPVRKVRKYGAAAAAENLSALPPAFQTVARKQQAEKNENIRRRQNASQRIDRKSRSPGHEVNSKDPFKIGDPFEAGAEDGFTSFKTEPSFFDCV